MQVSLTNASAGADNGLVQRDTFRPMLVAAGAVAIVPPALIHFISRGQVVLSSKTHFWSVVLSALVATAAGVALSFGGWRRGDARAVLVGTAFTVMASLLVVHGLASPGFIVEMNGVVSLTGAATLPVGAVILALSAWPVANRPRAVQPLLWLQGALMVGVVALGVAAMWLPSLVPSVPKPASLVAIAMLVVGVAFYGLLALRALRTVLLTRRRADLAVFVGLVWLAGALVPALMLTYLDLAWWLGHGLEVAGVLLVVLRSPQISSAPRPRRPLVGDLSGAELVSAEEAFLGSQVAGLMRLLAEKDAYTEGHTRRVALLAVAVGEQLGLAPARLRELATGGLLHDIGKLSVPDDVLQKPGALDDEEYALVQRHAVWGDTLLATSASRPVSGCWCAGTTSAWTAVGIPTVPPCSHSRPESSRSATSMTRCARSGFTGRPGRTSGRSSFSAKKPGRHSTAAAWVRWSVSLFEPLPRKRSPSSASPTCASCRNPPIGG